MAVPDAHQCDARRFEIGRDNQTFYRERTVRDIKLRFLSASRDSHFSARVGPVILSAECFPNAFSTIVERIAAGAECEY